MTATHTPEAADSAAARDAALEFQRTSTRSLAFLLFALTQLALHLCALNAFHACVFFLLE
jgi:hypothetical protein